MRSRKQIIKILLVFTIAGLFVIPEITNGMSSRNYWPTESWHTTTPGKQNMRKSVLNQVDAYIENWNEEHYFSNVDSIIVVKNGYIVKEAYFGLYGQEDIHAIWSITKSVTSILIGIAIDEGYIDSVEENVLDFFSDRVIANVDERKESVRLEHLLMMSTGFNYPGDDAIWMGWMSASDQVQYILDLPMAFRPGSYFNYDTGGSHLLSAILEKATNKSALEFAQEKLFNPLGITHLQWQYDKQGTYFGGHGLYLEPQDIAKLGYLYINNGTWDNEQIVSSDWVNYTTTTKWLLSDYWGYSHQWWTHPIFDAFAAAGRYGQRIIAIKDKDLVVTFTASLSDADPEPYFYILEEYVLGALGTEEIFLSIILFIPLTLTTIIVTLINSIKFRRKRRN